MAEKRRGKNYARREFLKKVAAGGALYRPVQGGAMAPLLSGRASSGHGQEGRAFPLLRRFIGHKIRSSLSGDAP